MSKVSMLGSKRRFALSPLVLVSHVALGLVLGQPLLGCSRDQPNEGKRLPKLGAPPITADAVLTIAVVVAGQPKAAITAATLASTKPDWADGPRRAWRFETLLTAVGALAPGGLPPGAQISVTGSHGVTVDFALVTPTSPLVPVIVYSQRGEVVAQFVDPADPFPSFHGEGGHLGRSPSPTPRVAGVSKLEAR